MYTQQIEFRTALAEVLHELQTMLTVKNAAYGNSALAPVSVFSTLGVIERLRVRIDDKISRIATASSGTVDNEDAELDLLGYLVLLRIARKQQAVTDIDSFVGFDDEDQTMAIEETTP